MALRGADRPAAGRRITFAECGAARRPRRASSFGVPDTVLHSKIKSRPADRSTAGGAERSSEYLLTRNLVRSLAGAKPAWGWPAAFRKFLFTPRATPTPAWQAPTVQWGRPSNTNPRSRSELCFVQRWRSTGPAGSGVADGVNMNWLNAVGHPAGGRRASLQDIRRSAMGEDRTDRTAPRAVDRSAGSLLIFECKTVSIGTS